MKHIGSYEAKTHLAQLLDEVIKGNVITITRRGVPIAILAPYQEKDTDAKLAVAELRNWRKGISWGKGMNTRKAIEEGRR
ncbi:MAG TPA: type II toxin-antitoxin system prevent-host-death family antitoxin [Gammaproteobacteria bacterium]|nr:type II toxin-antitoxin system prevent-host-death family antitoxin [Gammaproteobacteria bacterium]